MTTRETAKPAVTAGQSVSQPAGAWTLYGTYALCVLVGFRLNGFGPLLNGVANFLRGDAARIVSQTATPMQLIAAAGAFVALALPVAVIIAKTVGFALGETDNVLGKMFAGLDEKYFFAQIFITVLLEESFARELFYGVIGRHWTGTLAVYALFLAGNGIWALFHLYNLPDKNARNPLRVLTQFITGGLLTVVFLHFGFMAVLLVHFAFDMVAFCGQKELPWGRVSLMTGWYYWMVATIASIVMLIRHYGFVATDSHHFIATGWPGRFTQWLNSGQPQFRVAGWDFWDYVLISIILTALVAMALEFLAYDEDNVEIVKKYPVWLHFLVVPAMMAAAYGAFGLLGHVMTDTSHRVIVIAVVIALFMAGTSGSSLARTFWQNLTGIYVVMCCMMALGFWPGLLLVVLRQLAFIPMTKVVGRGYGRYVGD